MKPTEALARAAIAVGRALGRARRAAQHTFTGRPPASIIPYAGYGTPARVTLGARVIDDADVGEPSPSDSSFKNARRMFRVFDARRVAHAKVRIEYGGQQIEAEVDDRGFVRVELEAPDGAPFARGASSARWTLLSPVGAGAEPVVAEAPVYIPLERARFIVVSDVDDTIIRSSATSAVRLVMETLRHNVYRRVAFPGVATFYRALADAPELSPDPKTGLVCALPQGQNPVFYLTSSVWRVHGLLSAFFELHGMPAGPLLMSDRRLVHGTLVKDRHRVHKLGHLRDLLGRYPDHRLVLIGDCGQRDPEIFAELADEAPDRVAAIYLRDLGDAARQQRVDELFAEARAAGVAVCVALDSLTHARHAATHGLIDPARLDAIRRALPDDTLATEPATDAEVRRERPPELRDEPDATTPPAEMAS